MSLYDKFKGLLKPVTKEDPFFGTLQYQKVGFWEGKKFFTPLDHDCEITIEGGPDRPTGAQRSFYRELENRYEALKEEISQDLLEQLRNWREDFSESDVWEMFSLESFSIPDIDGGNHEWELVYDLRGDDHYFCIMMSGWEVRGIRVDG